MASSILVPPVVAPIAEYLNTSYQPDREYVDGELFKRNVGKNEHYLKMGVGTIWMIDPVNRTGRSCVGKAWIESETLQVLGTPIWVSLPEMFNRLDRTLAR